jgi:hypothetical protein
MTPEQEKAPHDALEPVLFINRRPIAIRNSRRLGWPSIRPATYFRCRLIAATDAEVIPQPEKRLVSVAVAPA